MYKKKKNYISSRLQRGTNMCKVHSSYEKNVKDTAEKKSIVEIIFYTLSTGKKTLKNYLKNIISA